MTKVKKTLLVAHLAAYFIFGQPLFADQVATKNHAEESSSDDIRSQSDTDQEASARSDAPTSSRFLRATLHDLQKHLDEDTIAAVYVFKEDSSKIWLVENASIIHYTLSSRDKIDSLATRAYSLLKASNKRSLKAQLTATMRQLSDAVIAPIASALDSKRIVFIKDGGLRNIPFASLPDPRSASNNPLLLRHEIIDIPSITTLRYLSKEGTRPEASRTLAVVADPVFDADDDRVTGASSSPNDQDARQYVPGASSYSEFGRLPGTRTEVESILSLVPVNDRLAATGLSASRETVTSGTLAHYRILHFATHGMLNDESPEMSELALSLVNEHGRPQDGRLRAWEISELDLASTELVVLSACQTGVVSRAEGEGLMGLSHGFLHAGSKQVVATLWEVNDGATARLMKHFYRELLANKLPPSEALRLAQIAVRSEPEFNSPFYWAAFVIQGKWN